MYKSRVQKIDVEMSVTCVWLLLKGPDVNQTWWALVIKTTPS